MNRHIMTYGTFLCVYALLLSTAGGMGTNNTQTSILTSEEAEELAMSDKEWRTTQDEMLAAKRDGSVYFASSGEFQQGPEIVFHAPKLNDGDDIPIIETVTTTELLIIFKEKANPIDMESLEVVAKKGWFSRSLTDRLKPFIQGTSIHAENVSIPAGKFLIEVSIADRIGQATTGQYLLNVAKSN